MCYVQNCGRNYCDCYLIMCYWNHVHKQKLYVYLCYLEYASQAYIIAGYLRVYEKIVWIRLKYE
jgi:hypothetical protein